MIDRLTTIPEAIAHASENRIDIFQGATKFQANDIVRGVDAEGGVNEELTQASRLAAVGASENRFGRLTGQDFLGQVGAGKGGNGVPVPPGIADDLRRTL